MYQVNVKATAKQDSISGLSFLHEIANLNSQNIDVIVNFIRSDPLAGCIKNPDNGDTAYHTLLGSDYVEELILPVLSELCKHCPKGLEVTNMTGNLPLHVHLCQRRLSTKAITIMLEKYPEGAGKKNKLGLIPLFLCVMSESVHPDICDMLCQAYPAGPQTRNQTNSFPLHFAAKRATPNKEILAMLLNRNAGAASHFNDFGMLPMHCMCSSTDDLEAIQMLYEAYPECLEKKDRQGRSCLHLAVLYASKNHVSAVMQEDSKKILEKMNQYKVKHIRHDDSDTDSDSGDSDEENEEDESLLALLLTERPGHHRKVIYYLVAKHPFQLVMENNFDSTPVDTVIEKSGKMTWSNPKNVQNFGSFRDPLTARILLLAHQKYFQMNEIHGTMKRSLSSLTKNHYHAMCDLNWRVRKTALLASYSGKLLWHVPNLTIKEAYFRFHSRNKRRQKRRNGKRKMKCFYEFFGISPNNLLARLRFHGHEDCLRLCISWL